MSKMDEILKEQEITNEQMSVIKNKLEKNFNDGNGNRSAIKVRIFGADAVYVETHYGSTMTKKATLEMARWIIDMLE